MEISLQNECFYFDTTGSVLHKKFVQHTFGRGIYVKYLNRRNFRSYPKTYNFYSSKAYEPPFHHKIPLCVCVLKY